MSKALISGGCACRAIRYEANEKPGFSFHCQCRQCQRATGGGHASLFMLPTPSVTITGELKFYDLKADSGNTVSRGFCSNCGSPVMARNFGYPDSRFFHVATLDDPSIFQPKRVVFRDAAQPWDFIDPEMN